MKKSFVLPFLSLPFVLASCGGSVVLSNVTNSSSSGTSASGNTLTSVFSSFGNNLTVNSTFGFLSQGTSATPVINAAYVEKGCFFKFTNFNSATNFGLVNVAANAKTGVAEGTYKWTDDQGALTLGAKVSATPSFRTLYNDPSLIGANYQHFVDAFVPEIQGAKSGYFYLNSTTHTGFTKDGSSALPYVDHSADVVLLSKYLGIYDTLSSIPSLSVDYVKLYFSDAGSTFTFRVYSKYENGFNGLETIAIVSKVGKTTLAAIDTYLGSSL